MWCQLEGMALNCIWIDCDIGSLSDWSGHNKQTFEGNIAQIGCVFGVANWPESCHFVSQHKQHQFPGILNYLLILWAWLPSNHESWCSILEYVALYERIVIRSIEGDTSFRWGLCHFSIRVRLCYEISQFMHEMLGDPHRFWAILMAYDGNQLWSVGRRFE